VGWSAGRGCLRAATVGLSQKQIGRLTRLPDPYPVTCPPAQQQRGPWGTRAQKAHARKRNEKGKCANEGMKCRCAAAGTNTAPSGREKCACKKEKRRACVVVPTTPTPSGSAPPEAAPREEEGEL